MTDTLKDTQAKYGLITEAEAAVVLRYAEANGGNMRAAVRQAVSERVAPYNTDEYKTMRLGEQEGAEPSYGEAASIGEAHSVPGLDPANDAPNPLVTDLTATDVDPLADKTAGQYETGPDGPVVEPADAAAADAAEAAKSEPKQGSPGDPPPPPEPTAKSEKPAKGGAA